MPISSSYLRHDVRLLDHLENTVVSTIAACHKGNFQDSGDAGQLSAPEISFVDEVSVEYSLNDTEIASNETCAVWATRDGTASGLAGIRISQTDCSTGFPLVQKAASNLRDFLYAEQMEPLLWEDQEVGRKCLVGILSEEAGLETAGKWWSMSLWLKIFTRWLCDNSF